MYTTNIGIVVLYYKPKNTNLQKNAKMYNVTNCNYNNYKGWFVIFCVLSFLCPVPFFVNETISLTFIKVPP